MRKWERGPEAFRNHFMLGNRLGWLLALLPAAILTWAAWQLVEFNRLTAETGLLQTAAAARPITIEVPPESIYAMTAVGDPTALYRDAMLDLRQNPEQYAKVERSATAEAFEKTPAGHAILTAAPMAAPARLASDATAWGGYGGAADDLDALDQAARLLMRAGLLHRAKDAAKSRQMFEAAFALGIHLFNERARYAEAALGLAIAREAAAGLRSLAEKAGDARRVGLLTTFDRSTTGLQDGRLSPVWRAVGSLDGRLIADHAGDVAALARPATTERMWRVEAALALGRQKFSLERDADRLAVPRRLKEAAAGETDPLVTAAIHAAESLTIEQYRTLR